MTRDGGLQAGIKFHLDPAMLAQLRNAPGFVPVIISVQPLEDLQGFLGVQNDRAPAYARYMYELSTKHNRTVDNRPFFCDILSLWIDSFIQN